MCNDAEFVDSVQSLLDAGNSMNKVAAILNVHHSKVNRILNRGLVEIYEAFDEEDRKHLYQNFEWLWEEDKLEEICDIAFDNLIVVINECLGDNRISVGRYTRENYGNLYNYLEIKNKSHLLPLMYQNCVTCGEVRNLREFSKKKNSLFGVNTQCNKCQVERYMKHFRNSSEFREKAKLATKKWIAVNKEKFAQSSKRGYHKRLARKKGLPDDLTAAQHAFTLYEFEEKCAVTGDSNIHLDHVIPLAAGHGGTTYGNMIPLRADLNISKNDRNIFEWFKANRQRFELSQERFDNLIAWLASANAMTVEEYRDYVYWCHANPRSIDEIENDKEVM
jgi:predicted transcriptional regulator